MHSVQDGQAAFPATSIARSFLNRGTSNPFEQAEAIPGFIRTGNCTGELEKGGRRITASLESKGRFRAVRLLPAAQERDACSLLQQQTCLAGPLKIVAREEEMALACEIDLVSMNAFPEAFAYACEKVCGAAALLASPENAPCAGVCSGEVPEEVTAALERLPLSMTPAGENAWCGAYDGAHHLHRIVMTLESDGDCGSRLTVKTSLGKITLPENTRALKQFKTSLSTFLVEANTRIWLARFTPVARETPGELEVTADAAIPMPFFDGAILENALAALITGAERTRDEIQALANVSVARVYARIHKQNCPA